MPSSNVTAHATSNFLHKAPTMKTMNLRPLAGVLIGIAVGTALAAGTGQLGVGIGVGTGLAIVFGGGAALLNRSKV